MFTRFQLSPEVTAGIDPDEFDQYLLKFVIVGDYGVGKTSLTRRFSRYLGDLGVEYLVRTFILDKNIIKIQLWDTAAGHQERYGYKKGSYRYRGSHGTILVYDVTNRDSFESIESKWLTDVLDSSASESIKVLVGNRCDLVDGRNVTYLEGKELADRLGLLFLETSAKDGTNVEQVFVSLASEIVKKLKKEKLERDVSQSNIKLSSNTKVIGNRINNCCRIN